MNFNANSGIDSLLIGDNSEPVQEPKGADGFAINVSNAIGNGYNGVDVDIAAQAFTGKDTIHVGAYIVGGFPEYNGSYIIPTLQWGANSNDSDTYNPNWLGFQANAYAIASGASSGPNGAVGFQNWVVTSAGAQSVGTVNILALGGEGSSSAETLTVVNPAGDSSATILFSTAISDSMSADWDQSGHHHADRNDRQCRADRPGSRPPARLGQLRWRKHFLLRRRLAVLRHHGPEDDRRRRWQQLL